MGSLEALLSLALNTYHELNTSRIIELAEAPSPLEFMRFVTSNKPFIIRNGAAHWPAVGLWTSDYLKQSMGNARIQVAITPLG